MTKKIRILFEVIQEYYWPAMEPLYWVMAKDPRYELALHIGPNHKRFMGIFLKKQKPSIEKSFQRNGFPITNTLAGYDAVICGDTLRKPETYGKALLCNVDHGPCFKSLRYRNLLKQPKVTYVVFAEGAYRIQKLTEHGLDKKAIIRDVGLPKLDPFFTGKYKKKDILERHHLDPEKKIVLYAPTYKPTSIYKVVQTIHELIDTYNVIVKLHPYSWSGKYAPHAQHIVFERLAAKHPKLCLVSPDYHDIMPYLFSADTMISEASSVINEFLALERCGIIVDLADENLKHSDGQPLLEEKTTEWLKNSFIHIQSPQQLASAVHEALNPSDERKMHLKRDKEFIYSSTDGTSALRTKLTIEELLGFHQ